MAHWSLDDIAWHKFDASKVSPQLVSLAKAASMVEYNGYDYAAHLIKVFADDEEFKAAIAAWGAEERQHGMVLRKWAELADPTFNFDESFKRFTDGYKIPASDGVSLRGSRCGELIARCIVETGTSAYYTAIKDYTGEPVLAEIAGKIAADEFRHYKLFYTHLQRYMEKDKVRLFARLKIALGRIMESEDDELAYAFYASHDSSEPYDRKEYINRYFAAVGTLYRKGHIERMIAMLFKAVGVKPHDSVSRGAGNLAWGALKWRTSWFNSYSENSLLPRFQAAV